MYTKLKDKFLICLTWLGYSTEIQYRNGTIVLIGVKWQHSFLTCSFMTLSSVKPFILCLLKIEAIPWHFFLPLSNIKFGSDSCADILNVFLFSATEHIFQNGAATFWTSTFEAQTIQR